MGEVKRLTLEPEAAREAPAPLSSGLELLPMLVVFAPTGRAAPVLEGSDRLPPVAGIPPAGLGGVIPPPLTPRLLPPPFIPKGAEVLPEPMEEEAP